MKQAYKEINLRADTLKLIDYMNTMIADYMHQGFTLSVRQLYYQLVARALIENTERSYKRIASIINDARLCGLIDWDAIEDRNRDIEMRQRWESGAQIIQASRDSFHMDMWDNQPHRVFIIVEKAALAGVLGGVSRKYDVPLLAARGYPSVSIVREMALQHIADPLHNGQAVTILHLGDHDPSGIDMTRDLRERFELFLGDGYPADNFELKRIALTMDQIEEESPPPNPAKTADSRFASYKREHGDESWELDALEPSYLVNLVTEEIDDCVDDDRWSERWAEVEGIRTRLSMTYTEFKKLGV
jgi:hypothetical protein